MNNKRDKYRNSELSPLDVFDFHWLYQENMDIEYSADYDYGVRTTI